ncbi:hypothetical protein DFH08DRAFT_852863 [Mycena albidolilacea]|uniref:Uncharacterized protein n=1 Tax=Mycena albidolilacea TaxID=1033008 RepID=A0AAD7AD58_9AGAR|nr:hypothetical protein DFH08DRAFT_852863 [Mycena albidolilacea]
MSGFHHYPRGYSTDENDASPEEFFQDPGQNFSSFMPYPEALWQAPAPGGEYNIHIDTSAVGPNSGIVNPNYTPVQSSYPTTSQQQWPQLPRRTSEGVTSLSQHWPIDIPRRSSEGSAASSLDHASGPAYVLPEYAEPGPFAFSPYQGYLHDQHISPTEHISPVGSAEDLLSVGYGSQHHSPHTTPPLHLTPPTTPGSQGHHSFTASPSPDMSHSPLLPFAQQQPQTRSEERTQPLYTHRDQLQFFKDALSLPSAGVSGPFVPQLMYKPHTNSDRRRYVEEVDMEAPIHFWVENPSECGIPLSDALHSRVRRLLKRDETVFEGRGPSVSIRLEWPGYRQWSRQIPTKDFRSPPGPITRAKLAKNVAKCVQRFIQERHGQPMEDDADARWRVGPGPNQIKLEDLILVSIHHVSMGSWQPHLRLRRPL